MAIPPGHEGQVRPRSGLARRHGVTVLDAPGTIDADYRGETAVLLINHGEGAFTIHHGDRIAQLLICPVVQVEPIVVAALGETTRGEGGYRHRG